MLPSHPADIIWRAFDPLLQRIDSLHAVTDLCAFYGPECLGLTLTLSVFILTGVVIFTRTSDNAEPDPNRPQHTAPMLSLDA